MSRPLKLAEMLDPSSVAAMLKAIGMSAAATHKKAKLFGQAAQNLLQNYPSRDTVAHAFFVPGRIEVLGKHTDYAGGRTIVAAAEQGFCLVAIPRNDSNMTVHSVNLDDTITFRIDPNLTPTTSHWSNYPMTVARRVARNFPGPLNGADIAFACDLPTAAGMSSSSALIIAVFLALSTINQLERNQFYRQNIDTTESLAAYLAAVENGQTFAELTGDQGVGTFGGSEDHTAILCCRGDTLSQYSYCRVTFERHLPMPPGHTFAIAVSGIVAEKTGAALEKYNRVSQLAAAVARHWCAAAGASEPHLAAILAANPHAPDQMRKLLRDTHDPVFDSGDLISRFEHFAAESEHIVPAAAGALAEGDLNYFARIVDLSQALAETLLANQVPQTIFLARTARQLGATAASAFGAGFGGSVWALIQTDKAKRLLSQWSQSYQQAFPQASAAAFFLTRPGPAATPLKPI